MRQPSTIPLLIPDVPGFDALEPWLRRIDANRHYTNFGPLNARLEQALAQRHGSADAPCQAVTFANGTAALVTWLTAKTERRKGRVLVPAITFTATAQAVLASGNIPLIADIDPATWLLSPTLAEEIANDDELVAIMPVAAYGAPCAIDAWDAVTRDHGIPVLIDAAGAFGNQRLGTTTDVAFSFHATKALAAGEGGAVLTRDPALAGQLLRSSNFGIDTANGLTVATGTNAKLSEYHAAVALASLEAWPDIVRRRQAVARGYATALATRCPGVRLPPRPADGIYTLMPVLLPATADAAAIAAGLAQHGIQTRRWYCPPLHRHPRFADCPRHGELTHAEVLETRLLGLPFHPGLRDHDIDRICTTLGELLAATPANHDAHIR